MIHPALQGKDYSKLKSGDPVFLDFHGNDILYQSAEEVYPLFINEVSYYEKGVAMVLTEKRRLKSSAQIGFRSAMWQAKG